MNRIFLWLACLGAAGLLACGEGKPTAPTGAAVPAAKLITTPNPVGDGRLRVMTRNIYLGTDINPILAEKAPRQIPVQMALAWQKVLATDFADRAGALADEIALAQPHLVGLQEVALYRLQLPGDYLAGNPNPATQVAFDFLDILLAALAERGLHYRAVASATGIDIELPMVADPSTSPPTLADLRYTDREVILARRDVRVSAPQGGQFSAKVVVPVAGTPLDIPRAWAAVDARSGGQTFRFLSAHLETARFGPIQEAQAAELVAMTSQVKLPTVLVGDLNSPGVPRAEGVTLTSSYQQLLDAGFVDLWTRANPTDPGFTCCHDGLLRNETVEFDRRIDLVLFHAGADQQGRTEMGKALAAVVGEESGDLSASGLWPSDHAGVWAAFRVQPAALARR